MREDDLVILEKINQQTLAMKRIADAYSRAYSALHQLALSAGDDIKDDTKRYEFFKGVERITLQLKAEAS